jgi:hypothetical protein
VIVLDASDEEWYLGGSLSICFELADAWKGKAAAEVRKKSARETPWTHSAEPRWSRMLVDLSDLRMVHISPRRKYCGCP